MRLLPRRVLLADGLRAAAAACLWAGAGTRVQAQPADARAGTGPRTDAGAAPLAGPREPLPTLVARVRPSVLPLGTYSATASPRFGFRGTGFVVGDGHLVATNAHVLPAPAEFESGQRLAVLAQSAARGREAGDLRFASIAALDRAHDLALLRLDGPPLQPMTLAGDDRAAEGKSIALIGFPVGGALGYAPVTHRGIIASLTTVALPAPTAAQLDPRALMRLRAGNFEVLQLDATAYPGNSGGPVLDADSGEVIGILNMVMVRGSRETALSAPTGISYAIPVRHLLALLDEVRSATPPR